MAQREVILLLGGTSVATWPSWWHVQSHPQMCLSSVLQALILLLSEFCLGHVVCPWLTWTAM